MFILINPPPEIYLKLRHERLLLLDDLTLEEKHKRLDVMAASRGQLSDHARNGHHKGVVFGWKSLAELAERFAGRDWLFRGHTEPQLALRPVVGREIARKAGYSLEAERRTLTTFRLRSRSYLENKPETDFEWLAVGRHHGLPTRLLDWTESFLVAVMFACIDSGINKKRQRRTPEICAIRGLDPIAPTDDPFSLASVKLYQPPHIAGRIPAQQGVFTVHPNPEENFDHPQLERWLVLSEAAFSIRKMLDVCGINESTLFPDISGLASYLTWRHKWSSDLEQSNETDLES
jgi:hypothetical protein